jgi:hypothetical protein
MLNDAGMNLFFPRGDFLRAIAIPPDKFLPSPAALLTLDESRLMGSMGQTSRLPILTGGVKPQYFNKPSWVAV